jgi:hypothetical protein
MNTIFVWPISLLQHYQLYYNNFFLFYLFILLYFFISGEHPDTKTMCMIVSDTDSVLVYDQTKLRWSAKLSFHPCIIARASFKVWLVALFIRDILSEMYCFIYEFTWIIFITGVTGMFGSIVRNRWFEILLPGHRTHDIYGSRKAD